MTKETACPVREDGQHCEHWYDCEPCCACGDETDGTCDCDCCEDDAPCKRNLRRNDA